MRRRLFLLQVRDQPEAEAQERACFVRACGVEVDEIETHNVVAEPRLSWSRVRHADALLVGGAGEHSATREYAFSAPVAEVVARWLAARRPFFGSCFGHHFVARLLGGRVITDPAREEVGSFEVELTADGRDDRLFSALPERFTVQLGHHDRVAELPAGTRALAHSRRCPNQAIALGDGLAYTTQFHPELTREDIRDRLMMYREGYLEGSPDPAAIDRMLGLSPHPKKLLRRFVELL